jgi:hypothetical protein
MKKLVCTQGFVLLMVIGLGFSSVANAGCKCPSGFSKVKNTCEKVVDTKSAKCDIGFELRVDEIGKRDRCFNIILGDGPTVPVTPSFGRDPSDDGWRLLKRRGVDNWSRIITAQCK